MAEKGHGNKVCAVKMIDDSSTFVSGGWDRNIIFWDLRKKTCIEQILGVKVGGEAIDVRGG